MTTLYGSADAIREEAHQLDPVKVLITLLLVVPYVLGYAVRLVWVAFSLLWTGAVHGWRICDRQIKDRQNAPLGN